MQSHHPGGSADSEFDFQALQSRISGMQQTPAEQFRRLWQEKVDDAVRQWENDGDRVHLENICIELYQENSAQISELTGGRDRLAQEFKKLLAGKSRDSGEQVPFERPSDEWVKDTVVKMSPNDLQNLAHTLLGEGVVRREVAQGLRPIGQHLHPDSSPTLPARPQFLPQDEKLDLSALDTEQLLVLARMPDGESRVARVELYEAMVVRASQVLVDLYNHEKSRPFLSREGVDVSKEQIERELREEIEELVPDKQDTRAMLSQAARLLESVLTNYRQMTD
jgi:hypothetical protein